LRFGAEKSQQREAALAALARLAEPIPVIALDASAAAQYGALRAHLPHTGTPIGNNELSIAAHAWHATSRW